MLSQLGRWSSRSKQQPENDLRSQKKLFAMEQPASSSKVTVEYHDPFNVYELLSPALLARLPLRTLHWESHAGPLRSIKSLHVDLVPARDNRASSSTTDLGRVKSQESTRSGEDGFKTQQLGKSSDDQKRDSNLPSGAAVARRHQIPGLRQTPYLKVYLLRCDDNDSYKATARKQVREWVKTHTPPTQSSSKQSAQENHDAFEYLILHVIVPNTAAAMQPRSSSKGSSTLYEKLRADFNSGSKNNVDRVAQIRIGINDVPYDRLPRVVPAIPGASPYIESQQEHEASWGDLMGKIKKLILDSFDSRVLQYEEDIREKDAQRTLPGWNFCTFFVLKEGLARGFENVGLVEDSLVGYDELAVGLDAIIREQAAFDDGPAHGGSFLPYTTDLLTQLEDAKKRIQQESEGEEAIDLQKSAGAANEDEILLSADRKPYRELILENKISIFEFKCYLFARQLTLLLRMGNASSSRAELIAKLKEARESALLGVAARQPPAPQQNEESENLAMLSDICRRSVDFLATVARIMRADLNAAALHLTRTQENDAAETAATDDPVTSEAIENIVSSFLFSVSQQILAQTATRALPIPPSSLAPISGSIDGDQEKATIPEPKTMMHPARSSSLIRNPPPRPPSPNTFPGHRTSSVPSESTANSHSTFLKAGLEDLAATRAHIYLLGRGVLEKLGRKRGWLFDLDLARIGSASDMEDVPLDEKIEPSQVSNDTGPSIHGVDNMLLRTALQDKGDFHRLYEIITDKALRHYSVAGHIQSVQASMADLALLRFYLRDYAGAASYLYRMTRFYGDSGWEDIQMPLLVVYTECLKELKRYDECVKATMTLLARATARMKAQSARRAEFKFGFSSESKSLGEEVSVEGYLTSMMALLPELQHDIALPLQSFFAGLELDGGVNYQEQTDAFALHFKVRYLLPDNLVLDKGKVRLVTSREGHGRDIWLEMEAPVSLEQGATRVKFSSNVMIPGVYLVKQVVLYASKMVMGYDVADEPSGTPQTQAKPFVVCPPIVLHSRLRSFDVKLSASRHLHLAEKRALEVAISSGWNEITSGELHIRAATGGLRLQTSEATVVEGNLNLAQKSDPGVFKFSKLASSKTVRISIPYTLEQEVPAVSLKLESSFVVNEQTFFYANTYAVSVMLPLGVNVQDCFKQKALFSKFSISSAMLSPLRLLRSTLDESDVFEATDGGALEEPVVIYPRLPASLLYKVTRRDTPLAPPGKKQRSALQLRLNYMPLEEEIDEAVTNEFTAMLSTTDLVMYSPIIIPSILAVLHSRLSPQHLEHAAMLGELSTTELARENWLAVFSRRYPSAAMRSLHISFAEFVQAALKGKPIIRLPAVSISEAAISKSRSITIPVEVPPINVVHSADLRIDPAPEHSVICGNETAAVLNQAIAATLILKSTRIWDKPDSSQRDKDLAFTYELSAPADTWLIGGRRRGGFIVPAPSTTKKSKALKFPVLLIPLKEGFLPYPNLEIRPVPVSKIDDGSRDGQVQEERVSTEVEWKNAASVVRVNGLPCRTTVSLDAGVGGGVYLVESERAVV